MHGAGWCFVAAAQDVPAQLAAMASYVVHPLQLVGVPVVLVADLAVDPDQRRRGLARNLQRFAYAYMHGAGYRWVYGNIDPGNLASRRQGGRNDGALCCSEVKSSRAVRESVARLAFW